MDKNKASYNKKEFDYLLKLIKEKKYLYAEEEFIKYLRKYPKDVCAHIYHAINLIVIGRLDEASLILNSDILLENNIKESNKILAFYTKIRLLICMEKYLECYEFIRKNMNMFYISQDDRDIEIIMFLKKKLNILNDKREDVDSYFLEQVIEYKTGSFFSYMTKYLSGNDIISNFKFKENFPFKEVYYKLREMLPNENKLNNSPVINSYFVKFDKCGIVFGKEVNYFKVVTIANSNEIVVMYPCEYIPKLPYIDLNLTYQDENVKVKTLSQVEKFNLRYNKKR